MSTTSEYYRAQAAACAREANAATLANVRERCLRAEAAWLSMAERISRSEAMREAAAVEKATRDSVPTA